MSIDIKGICHTYNADYPNDIFTDDILALSRKNAREIYLILKDLFFYIDEGRSYIKSDRESRHSFLKDSIDLYEKSQEIMTDESAMGSFALYDRDIIEKAKALLVERYIEDPTLHGLKKYMRYKLQDDLNI